MKTVAIYNIKGGVGKTTVAANIAYFAAQNNFRTLLCDLDPQGSVSYYFRIRPHKKFNSKKFLSAGNVEKFIRGSDFDNLDLLPADFSFRKLDIMLDSKKKSRKQLKQVLSVMRNEYDLLLLDCPPNITLLSENIFRASDIIMVPLIPTTLSVITYGMLIDFFEKNSLDITKLKPVFSMVEKRKKMHRDIIHECSDNHPGVFFNTKIPYNSNVEKMGLYREPVNCFAPRTSGARAFGHLWEELEDIL
jgi:cellulose biosynthesis protein BcsQ